MIKQGGLLLRAGKIILILTLLGAGFFCMQKSCWAVSAGDVVINEIMWAGSVLSSADEFIELRNTTDNPINLSGWQLTKYSKVSGVYKKNLMITVPNGKSIPANGYFLIANYTWYNVNSILNVEPDLVATTVALANTKLQIKLYDGDWENGANLIDVADDGVGEPVAGDNADVKKSMERNNVPSDGTQTENWHTCSQAVNFDQGTNDCGTPKKQNSSGQETPPEEPPKEESTSPQPSPSEGEGDEQEQEETLEEEITETYKLGDVVINEFVSDPTDKEVEWIELYNITNKEIILDGWTIEEGSGAKTTLIGIMSLSGDNKFFVIEKPKGNLNNKGDIIILRDSAGTLIDQAAYGNWDDGNTENNAPVTGDPYSVARKFDGQNSFNNANDFAVTATLTKGASNIITKTKEEQELTDEISAEEKANYDYSNDIIITEIFPNPTGSDKENEFIELCNKGGRDVNLTGWKLGDESKKRFEFKDAKNINGCQETLIIKVDEYFVIYRSESKIALNNGNDSVKLYQPLKDEPCQIVKYKKAVEGWSYNLETPTKVGRKYNYVWSEIVTPGTANEIKTINHPPIVDFDCPEKALIGAPILFDSSDTIDEDGDKLKFNWNFGDGFTNNLSCPEHTFFQQGAWTVKLAVNDGENEVEKEKIVMITSPLTTLLSKERGIGSSPSPLEGEGRGDVIINEFLPNPEGADAEGEFIELYNQGEAQINLINWKVDDIEGGSKPYTFDIDLWLGNKMRYVLHREESGLALNNTTDAVRLFNNFNELIEEIKYESTIEGEAYARGKNGKWFWTTVVTPGEENVISVADSNESKIIIKSANNNKNAKKEKQIIETTLEKIHECEIGDLVKVAGIVAVKPGILGSQYFYIVGSAGIQIYNYKKDFPALKVGDYIEVQGELSVSSGELRLKTKTADDFKIIKHGEPPSASKANCEQVDEKYVGRLITVTGEVVERKSSIVYLDDGTNEVIVYLKTTTGIKPKSIKEGEIITVTGLVGRTKSGIRIMPRSIDDIIKKDPQSHSDGIGQVLGEVAASDVWKIAQRDKKIELFQYLLTLACGAIIALSGLLIKLKIKK